MKYFNNNDLQFWERLYKIPGLILRNPLFLSRPRHLFYIENIIKNSGNHYPWIMFRWSSEIDVWQFTDSRCEATEPINLAEIPMFSKFSVFFICSNNECLLGNAAEQQFLYIKHTIPVVKNKEQLKELTDILVKNTSYSAGDGEILKNLAWFLRYNQPDAKRNFNALGYREQKFSFCDENLVPVTSMHSLFFE